jgi:hypothetical protein
VYRAGKTACDSCSLLNDTTCDSCSLLSGAVCVDKACPTWYVLCCVLQCVTKCCEKFMNVSARTGARFQEFFTEMEKQVSWAGGAR